MSHLSSKCDCGRTIHLPKDAPLGYKWECLNCGKVWTLSTEGKPTRDTRSKQPPKSQPEYQQSRPSYSSNTGSGSGTGCMLIGFVLFSAFAGGTYKIITYFLS